MLIDAAELEHNQIGSPLSDDSRHFYESIALPKLRRTKAHAGQLDGLVVVADTWDGGPGLSSCWTMTFTYRGQSFFVDTNYHAALSEFFVADAECPNDILLEVLRHFDALSPLRVERTDDTLPPAKSLPVWLILLITVVIATAVVFVVLGSATAKPPSAGVTRHQPPFDIPQSEVRR